MIHCCFTSHHEVMFRCPQDVGFFLNLLALTSWKYGVDIFADTEMSNHVHLLLFSSDKTENRLTVGPYSKTVNKAGLDRDGSILYSDSNQLSDFITALRKRYTWYFTQKYLRDCGGRMGEKYYFSLIIEGNYHMISACSYVLRNGKPAIGISDIEPIHNEDAVKSYLYNERAATFRNCRNDIDLCGIIDRCILPEFKSPSIYQLSRDKRESIKKILMNDFHVSDSQASRCLWL